MPHDTSVLRTLVISPDMELVWKVEPALRQLEFEMDVKTNVADALDKMRYERYCAVVIDCSSGNAAQLCDGRERWLKRDPVVIAIAGEGTSNFDGVPDADAVWTQPLMPWEVYRTLLDARARATGDRRLRGRYKPPRPSVFRYSFDGVSFFQATIIDITETGVSIEGVEEMVSGGVVHADFKLPAMLSSIRTMADVVWRNGRRAGLRFLQMPQQQHRQLERWLNQSRQGMSTGYSYASGF